MLVHGLLRENKTRQEDKRNIYLSTSNERVDFQTSGKFENLHMKLDERDKNGKLVCRYQHDEIGSTLSGRKDDSVRCLRHDAEDLSPSQEMLSKTRRPATRLRNCRYIIRDHRPRRCRYEHFICATIRLSFDMKRTKSVLNFSGERSYHAR